LKAPALGKTVSDSGQLTLFSGGAMRRFLVEALPLFERDSGIRIETRFAPTREHMAAIESGDAFDIALLPRWAIDQLTVNGHIAAGSASDAVRSLVGLMVRDGAPLPDISTVEALKRTLRRAKSVSYSKGPSGLWVAEMLERIGMAPELMDKVVFAIGRPVGAVIASGEAEIGMQQIIEITPVQGARLVGPLPEELTNYVLYSTGFAPGASRLDEARALARFLASPASVAIIRGKGMAPG
jgi:molybdate transport system substrate-binding protein